MQNTTISKLQSYALTVLFAGTGACLSLFLMGAPEYLAAAVTVLLTFSGLFFLERKFALAQKVLQSRNLLVWLLALVYTVICTYSFYRYCFFENFRLVFALGSAVFLLCVFQLFFSWLVPKLLSLWQTATLFDRIVFGVFCLIAFVFVLTVCLQTEAFYYPHEGEVGFWDVIFTSDSLVVYRADAFFNFSNTQNDLRQPFFSILAIPFAVPAKLISYGLFFFDDGYAVGILFMQLVALFAVSRMLCRCLHFTGWKKHLFSVLFFSCFAQMLFGIVVEQYIFALFWLVFAVNRICEGKDARALVALSAGGLLTSIAVAPFAYEGRGKGKGKLLEWCKDMLGIGLVFVFLLCISGQLYQFMPNRLWEKWQELTSYGGGGVAFLDRLYQYTHFISNQFASPQLLFGTRIVFEKECGFLALTTVDSVSWAGILILITDLVCFVYCRKEKMAQVSLYWILFSVLLLLVVGWGSAENGQILYSVYFCWAYLALPCMAFKKVTESRKYGGIVFGCVVGAAAVGLLVANGIALGKIMAFALEYYPL